jgi:hypothetical protein
MLSELSVSSSSLDFTNSNYNYDNTNTNVSSHLCNNCNIDLANMAKNNNESMSAGTYGERDLLKAKAMKNLKDGYIELIYETGWKRPIQAYLRKKFHGKIETYHFFSEWNTFEEAIEWLKHAHKCPIIINRQIGIGI